MKTTQPSRLFLSGQLPQAGGRDGVKAKERAKGKVFCSNTREDFVFFMSWKTLTSEQFSIDWPTPLRLQSPTQSSLISTPSCWSVKSLHFLCWESIPTTLQPPCLCWEKKDLFLPFSFFFFGCMHNLLQQHKANENFIYLPAALYSLTSSQLALWTELS